MRWPFGEKRDGWPCLGSPPPNGYSPPIVSNSRPPLKAWRNLTWTCDCQELTRVVRENRLPKAPPRKTTRTIPGSVEALSINSSGNGKTPRTFGHARQRHRNYPRVTFEYTTRFGLAARRPQGRSCPAGGAVATCLGYPTRQANCDGRYAQWSRNATLAENEHLALLTPSFLTMCVEI